MELNRRSLLVYALLGALWALVIAWQIQEHLRVGQQAKAELRHRSRDIANTLGAFVRGLQWRGAIFGDRLQPVLDELVSGESTNVFRAGEVLSIALLNAAGEAVASAGNKVELDQNEILQQGERWGARTLTVVFPIEGVNVTPEGGTNTTGPVVLPRLTNTFRDGPRPFRPREGRQGGTNADGARERQQGMPPPPPNGRFGRPFWARGMEDTEYQGMIQRRELHGVVLAMSTEKLAQLLQNDLWLRFTIAFFATLAVLGSALAWRNVARSSELEIRLVRASEQNTHLKEMNLAAAGLAHETRNPLNIIRGLAQMISRQQELPSELQAKAKDIVGEADKVAAQVNEFISYSRPRELRPVVIPLASAVQEVVRALNYDLEEKKVNVRVNGDQLSIEADEQLLRQALFNLILNAVQAVRSGGEIQVSAERKSASEAVLEIRDNGPGVPAEHRSEIFKPYFTTQEHGTGLGLAVVQQIVLAHGWEIQCLPNVPEGAIFRISHLIVKS